MKKLLVLFLLSLTIPAFAGEFEKAYSSGENVLVYFYSPSCIACEKFNPYFDEISKQNKDIKCVKVNIDTRDGMMLMRKYHCLYIPYLILTNSKIKSTKSIGLNCAINQMCFERVLKSYNKQSR